MYSYKRINGMFRIFYDGRKTTTFFAEETAAQRYCNVRNKK